MSTSIEWTRNADGSSGETWNPTSGCDKVSPGCGMPLPGHEDEPHGQCYALVMSARLKAMGQAKYQNDGDPRTSGPGFGLTVHPDALDIPLRRRKPTTWFVNSMSDLWHKDVPDDFIEGVLSVINTANHHTYQMLTKRPQRMASLMSRVSWDCNGDLSVGRFTPDELALGDTQRQWYDVARRMPQLWLGTSIESDRYTFRADHLRATPAAVRFLSCEPLLGPLPSLNLDGIDWVIAGAESGRGARSMNMDWVRDLRDRCVGSGTAFFLKQDAVNGRKVKLPELDGEQWVQMPKRKVAV